MKHMKISISKYIPLVLHCAPEEKIEHFCMLACHPEFLSCPTTVISSLVYQREWGEEQQLVHNDLRLVLGAKPWELTQWEVINQILRIPYDSVSSG